MVSSADHVGLLLPCDWIKAISTPVSTHDTIRNQRMQLGHTTSGDSMGLISAMVSNDATSVIILSRDRVRRRAQRRGAGT
jgi:hypothetical protein